MKIKLEKQYGISPKGTILDVAEGVATLLIGRKIASEIKAKRGKKNEK